MCFSGLPVCLAVTVCLSSVLHTRGTLQYVGDQEQMRQKKTIRKLKEDSMFLLNYVESNLHDKPIQKDMEKSKYKQAVSKCKEWRI